MKKFFKKLWLAIVSIFNPKPLPKVVPPFDPLQNGYKRTFSEDFSRGIDWSKWHWLYPGDQSQKGIVICRKENVSMAFPAGIKLVATADKQFDYCGLISSHRFLNVLFGFIEVTAKVPPNGLLYFPAIWMYNRLGWQPEIDILECASGNSDEAWFTHHWVMPDGSDNSEGYTWKPKIDLSMDYHRYAVEWTPEKLTWYVDGIALYSTTNKIPDVALFIICNIQAGGTPPFTHLFTPDEVPMNFYISKIEVYQKL